MEIGECKEQMLVYQKYNDAIAYFKQFHGEYLDKYAYVDLGLSVNWASCNFGATTDLDRGVLVGWENLFKNEDLETLRNKGFIDLKNNIKPKYSICSIGKWRLPSKDEFDELFEKCTWVLVKTPAYGLKIIGPNDNSIFLPLGGYVKVKSYGTDQWKQIKPYEFERDICGFYWSSTFNISRLHPDFIVKAGRSKVLTACACVCSRTGSSPLYCDLDNYFLNVRLVCDKKSLEE